MREPCTCPPVPCPACRAHAGEARQFSGKKRLPLARSPYTLHRERIAVLYAEGVGLKAIAQVIGGTDKGVLQHLKRVGLWHRQKPGPGQGWRADAYTIAAYQSGTPITHLARLAGKSVGTLIAGLRRAGVHTSRVGNNQYAAWRLE